MKRPQDQRDAMTDVMSQPTNITSICAKTVEGALSLTGSIITVDKIVDDESAPDRILPFKLQGFEPGKSYINEIAGQTMIMCRWA